MKELKIHILFEKFKSMREPNYGIFHPASGPCAICGGNGQWQLSLEQDSKGEYLCPNTQDSQKFEQYIRSEESYEDKVKFWNEFWDKHSMPLCESHADEWHLLNGWVKSSKHNCFIKEKIDDK